jgi:Phosphotransferase enzyme family
VRSPATNDLEEALRAAVAARLEGTETIRSVGRRPSEYRSSFGLEEVDITLSDGGVLELMFKDLSRRSLDEEGRRAKPLFLYEPRREITVYRNLVPVGLGPPRYWGSVIDEVAGRFWLFVERVPAIELYQVGDVGVWEEAARWLPRVHAALSKDPERSAAEAHLLRHDARYYQRWIERATAFASSGWSGAERRRLRWLALRYDQVVERLTTLPRAVIHGELYASNVLVGEGGRRICAVDWEMAALGSPLLDVAALTTGWDRPVQKRLERAYLNALDPGRAWALASVVEAIATCRLALAIQWLGWSASGWSPPKDQRRDWLCDAVSVAEQLNI